MELEFLQTKFSKIEEILHEKERLYTDLFENAPDPIAVLDTRGFIKQVNPAAETAIGYRSEELVGKHFAKANLLKASSLVQAIGNFAMVMAGRKIPPSEYDMIHKNGQQLIFEAKPRLIKIGGKNRGIQIIFRDITERKKKDAELKNAYEKLRVTQIELIQAEKLAALGRFSTGVAHEVKNPLGVILGGIEFIERKTADQEGPVREVLKKMKDSTFRADKIVQGLLRFARPSLLEKERVKAKELVQEALELFNYKAPLANISIETRLDEKIWVEVDKNQIHQALFNVISNAIESMPGGGKLTVSASVQNIANGGPAKDHGVIDVTDTGEGIDEQNLSKIGEPFFTTKRDRKGTGLGLSITKQIIENLGGVLRVQSQKGAGTTMKIVLPLAAKESD